MQQFLVIATVVFLAELGDKTQIATLLFATDKNHPPYMVFIATVSALTASTALAVALGMAAERYLTAVPLKFFAGLCFVLIGFWTIWEHVRSQ